MLSLPPFNVRSKLGRYAARAASRLASAARNCASARAISGRRNKSSEGRPDEKAGTERDFKLVAARLNPSGLRPSRMASWLLPCITCCSSDGMAAFWVATTLSCSATSRADAVPTETRARMASRMWLAKRIFSFCNAIRSLAAKILK